MTQRKLMPTPLTKIIDDVGSLQVVLWRQEARHMYANDEGTDFTEHEYILIHIRKRYFRLFDVYGTKKIDHEVWRQESSEELLRHPTSKTSKAEAMEHEEQGSEEWYRKMERGYTQEDGNDVNRR